MHTILKLGKGVFKSKGSKFISFTHHLEDINQYRRLITFYKMENPDSCHVCSAYRLLINSRIDEQASDDGEPKGSAGNQILNQLKRNDLINAGTFVVRIFGGTLLGIPGLIEAYSNSSLFSIDNSIVVPWKEFKIIKIHYNYDQQSIIESLVKKYKAKILHQDFEEEISINLSIEKDIFNQFTVDLENLSSGLIKYK